MSRLSAKGTTKRAARHSVDAEVPDHSISHLYPPEDNYQPHPANPALRQPKSLTELCIDAVCRSLPDLEGGELPPHLPQDVVDRIAASLTSHAALNSTTLRALSRCELGSLSLANCRGVSDEWLVPLSSSSISGDCNNRGRGTGSASTASCDGFPGANSDDRPAPFSPPAQFVVPPHSDLSFLDVGSFSSFMMDLDDCDGMDPDDLRPPPLLPSQADQDQEGRRADNIGNSNNMEEDYLEESYDDGSRSTSSFVSASSSPLSPLLPGVLPPPELFSLKWSPGAPSSLSPLLYHTRGGSVPMDGGNDGSVSPPLPQKPLARGRESRVLYAYNSQHDCDAASCGDSGFVATSTLALLDLRGSQRVTDRGLLRLSHPPLRSLEVAKLDNCHGITGKGLLAFSRSHRLHTLSLANCRRLTDEAVVNVGHLGESLTALNLGGCRCLTDRSLEALGRLVGLKKLDLSQCDLITDEGLVNLNDLSELEELSLGWCRRITDDGLEALSGQPGRLQALHTLRLARCNITDTGMDHLTKFEGLEELDLNGCVGVSSLALGGALGGLTRLASLDVSYCPGILRSSWQGKVDALRSIELCYSGVRDSHLARLRRLPNLEELNLDSCLVGDWGIAHLVDNEVAPNLKTLDLADTDISDAAMAKIARGFVNMKHLSLFYCNITNRGLRYLASMMRLEVLNLDSREIGDDGLRYLRGLPLRSLDLFSSRVTDLGCAHLSKIKTLTSLELCGGGVGDVGCAHLATLPNLTSLNLSQNENITNRGAASLTALSSLKALNLSNTRVTSDALQFLGGLVKLQSLALYGCKDVEDNLERLTSLQSELPSLRCLRLNGASNKDGVIYNSHESDESDEEEGGDEEEGEVGDGNYYDELNEDDQSGDTPSGLDRRIYHQIDEDGYGSVSGSEGGSMSDFQDAHANEVQSVDMNQGRNMDYEV